MFFIKIFFLSLILTVYTNEINAKVNIKYKVGDQIITNLDILDEKNYLIFLRPELKEISEKEILKLSENSLIREIIKKKELDIIFKNIESTDFIEDLKINLFNFKGVNNENDFKLLLKKSNIEYEKIIEKVKYEGMWNELIFRKFNSLLRIDENKLRNELNSKISNNKKYEFNLSEMLIEINVNENIDDKYLEILNSIKVNGFKNSSSKYSISNSAIKGGEIGWVKETLLSEKLSKILNSMDVGDITEPLKYPSGYLILKINDKKEMKQIIDFERELKELVSFEKNKQLNQFSLLFYKKLKQNTKINEF